MEVIFILLPAALIFAVVAVVVYCWATRSGQFDDLDTPALRMLADDVPPHTKSHGAAPAVASGSGKKIPEGENSPQSRLAAG